MTAEPTATRPDLPPGYADPSRPWTPLPWSFVDERLSSARTYWVASTRDRGRPIVRPFWGVWLDRTVMFSTGGPLLRYLRARPEVTIHLDDGDQAVILEGEARFTGEPAAVAQLVEAYNPKYRWNLTLETAGEIIVVQPKVVFAWTVEQASWEDDSSFGDRATRFLFR